ncbi:MAG: hypothetical protein A2150_00765 [Candidatus Muproteobacteria bacterium RBG_16_64_11]|uniref:DUF4412 domain-containing protein n=1 Tax=Candidatus Muproteobacteria bacterium RBG_16_64_11 TaxID=1817758 RepID=A0A1F6TE21_9PROT|nr:MAG: hypothetical protein A2150_00765 [Candidatus Muproteobacteria bacterium RBG_16_64_11]
MLTACAWAPRATLLEFSEQEGGGEPYATRMLVVDDYLRIDDGQGSDGFILLDRPARTIYSVSHADKTVLVIAPRKIELAPPAVFEHAVERDDEPYPQVAGKPVRRYTLTTNKQRCVEVFAADGLLPGAVAALREYQEILAGEQAFTAARRPKELQDDCALAADVFVPARHLAFGFPVKQTNSTGKARDLIDFRTGVAAEPGLFELPAGYRRYSLSERLR